MTLDVPARSMKRDSLARLKRYRVYSVALLERGCEFVTCSHLAEGTGVSLEALLDDLEALHPVGEQAFELDLKPLVADIDHALGWDRYDDVFVAGAGHLASVLLDSESLGERGLNVVAVFDDAPGLAGTSVNGHGVLPLSKLPDLARRMGVHIGVIAVDGDNAQEAADLMVNGGIEGIVCWSDALLSVPDGVALAYRKPGYAVWDLVQALAPPTDAQDT